jgi:hypothetical protein
VHQSQRVDAAVPSQAIGNQEHRDGCLRQGCLQLAQIATSALMRINANTVKVHGIMR